MDGRETRIDLPRNWLLMLTNVRFFKQVSDFVLPLGICGDNDKTLKNALTLEDNTHCFV
jgi:hypothetical protein